jgi:hypothetical protein
MKKLMLVAAAAALSACNQGQPAETDATNEMAEVTTDATAQADGVQTSQTLAGTSWEWTRDGVKHIESIDENGNYIADTADGKHADHGTYVMKDGQACFTSAMNEDGEECWPVKDIAIGETVKLTSNKGNELDVTRVEYRPLTMPS